MWQPQGFYNQYVLRTPVILSGEESIRGLYNYSAARIAVIHGTSFEDEELFKAAFSKKDVCFIKRSWTDEPDIEGLKGTIGQLEEYQPDTIIAVGGGSIIDGSKLCRLFYEFPYFDVRSARVNGKMMCTHFIAVPTTIGSGSEVSSAAVFVDRSKHRKDMVVLHELQPDVVVYDKRYVENTPNRLLCASALDAMAHIVEGYVSNIENFLMDIMSEKGLSLLCSELQELIEGKKDTVNYQRLQYAGFIGGLVQNHSIVGAAHAIAHQLTEQGYSHGEAVALILPVIIELNSNDNEAVAKYQKLAKEAGFSDIGELVSFIYKVLDYSGIGERQEDLRILLRKLSGDALFFENVKNDRGGKGNPVDITDSYIEQIIRRI